MAPKRRIPFPAAEPKYRAERLNAATSCQNYNRQREDASAEERTALWLAIVNANKSPRELHLAQSEASLDGAATSPASARPARAGPAHAPLLSVASPAATRSSFDTVPRPGTLPAIRADPNLDTCGTKPPSNSTASAASPASLAGSSLRTSALSPKHHKQTQFPGAGVAPYIKPPLYIDYATRLEIAPSTFINRNCTILDTPVSSVRIGERCLIGPNFSVYAVEHPIDCHDRCGPTGAPSFGMDVAIEDDCWIGGNVTVLGGVTIGRGCAIGAGSLVTKDIPACNLAYGSPARVIRRIGGPAPRDVDPNVTSVSVWKVPDHLCPAVYGRVRIGGHEFVTLELAAVLLFLVCALFLLYYIS